MAQGIQPALPGCSTDKDYCGSSQIFLRVSGDLNGRWRRALAVFSKLDIGPNSESYGGMSTTETRRETPSRRGARAVSDTGSNLNTLTALATLARLSCALGPTAMCLSAMVPAKGRRWSNIPSISERQHHNRSTTLISRPLWNGFGSGIGIPDTGVDNTTSGYGAKLATMALRPHRHTISAVPLLVVLEAMVDTTTGAVVVVVGDAVTMVAGHQHLMDTDAPPSVMGREGC
ncbi:hypothetical protein B0T09DRAFT_319148 [Sordaria sp. MPI-SDFR-AT-0083]|nr:hypothetical protein B0T09DRAFT_319148 [Sordaria sp. MPI-SDFR-AT-0083]